MDVGSSVLELPVTSTAERPKSTFSVRAFIGLTLVAFAHIPVVWHYCASLLSLPQYEYILALPIFAGILLYVWARELGPLVPGSWVTASLLFLISAGMLTLSGVLDSPWFGVVAFLAALPAVAYSIGGAPLTRAVAPAWLVLCLMIRLPLESDVWLVQSLQTLAAQKASTLLHLVGQPHLLDGNVVETPVKRYAVEEACSGVQSLFAITACTVFFVLWSKMSWWRSLLVLLTAWWWVWVANVARVVIVTWVNSNWGLPVDEGWMHDALGIALFVGTLALIVSSGHLLWFVFPFGVFGGRDATELSAARGKSFQDEIQATEFPPLGRTFLASIPLVVLYAAVGALLWLPQLKVPAANAAPSNLNLLESGFAPETVAGWKLVPNSHRLEQRRADSQWGARSQSWRYEKNGRQLIVSIDYPFLGWHDLGTCYHFGGWDYETRQVLPVSTIASTVSSRGDTDRFVEITMRKKTSHEYGLLVFQCFNNRREPMPIPEINFFKAIENRIHGYRQRIATLGATGSELHSQAETYQLQVFLADENPLLSQDSSELRQLFIEFRTLLAQVVPGTENPAVKKESAP